MSPDIRKHRGAHPDDRALFADDRTPVLRAAVNELSWLLTRNYSLKGALKLVGDRHALTGRQRVAITRAACSDHSKQHRVTTACSFESVRNDDLIVDGFNIIITIEAALSGGLLLLSRDRCVRDLSSVHGSYRSVNETDAALGLIGEALATLEPRSVNWVLDRPISNSGRLAERIKQLARARDWRWNVETSVNPDREMVSTRRIVISSDGPLLDQVDRWLNLAPHVIEKSVDAPWLIDLS